MSCVYVQSRGSGVRKEYSLEYSLELAIQPNIGPCYSYHCIEVGAMRLCGNFGVIHFACGMLISNLQCN